MFDAFLARWDLTPDGPEVVTRSSHLLPVRYRGTAAMLKVALESEERFGGVLMEWWDGVGAARVLARDDHVLLLERAEGTQSLSDFARTGRDDVATHIICDVVAKLHAPRSKPLPDLIPLDGWFGSLDQAAAAHGGFLTRCATTARELLASPRDVGVLHGDIHHDNILDFGPRGWLAIDPKRLVGERGFDYANLFCNPGHDAAALTLDHAALFPQRLATVCAVAGLERARLLKWIVAWCGLSAAWFIEDGETPATDFTIAALAAAELDR